MSLPSTIILDCVSSVGLVGSYPSRNFPFFRNATEDEERAELRKIVVQHKLSLREEHYCTKQPASFEWTFDGPPVNCWFSKNDESMHASSMIEKGTLTQQGEFFDQTFDHIKWGLENDDITQAEFATLYKVSVHPECEKKELTLNYLGSVCKDFRNQTETCYPKQGMMQWTFK